MNETIIDRLDRSIAALLDGDESIVALLAERDVDPENAQLRDLLLVASHLHSTPRPGFRARLRTELEAAAARPELVEGSTPISVPVERRASSPVGAAEPRNLA